MMSKLNIQQSWDVVGIGSSPLMLLHAASVAKSGARVLLVDKHAIPGGAWRIMNIFGFKNVETSVHLIENRAGLAQMLSERTGVKLPEEPPKVNFGLFRSKKIEFSKSRVILHSLVSAKALIHGDWAKTLRIGKSAQRAFINLKTPFFYPSGGMNEIVQILVEQIQRAGGEILLGHKITKVNFKDKKKVKIFISDHFIEADKVIFTSRAHAPICNSDAPDQRFDETNIQNVVLHFDGVWCRPTAYVEIFGDRNIKRIRNIANLAKRNASGLGELVCLQLRRPYTDSPAKCAKTMLAHLIRLGIISQDSQPREALLFEEKMETISNPDLRRLERQFSTNLQVIYSTDFAEALL